MPALPPLPELPDIPGLDGMPMLLVQVSEDGEEDKKERSQAYKNAKDVKKEVIEQKKFDSTPGTPLPATNSPKVTSEKVAIAAAHPASVTAAGAVTGEATAAVNPICANFKCPSHADVEAAKLAADKARTAEMKRKTMELRLKMRNAGASARAEAYAKKMAEWKRKRDAVVAANALRMKNW